MKIALIVLIILVGALFVAPVVPEKHDCAAISLPNCEPTIKYLTLYQLLEKSITAEKATSSDFLLPEEKDDEDGAPVDGSNQDPELSPISENTVAYKEIDRGSYSGLEVTESKRISIHNDADWRQLWSEHNRNSAPIPTRPEVDFTKQIVLAVYTGVKSTGGTSIEITNIQDSGGTLEVYVYTKSSGRGCNVTTAFSHPYHIVLIEATEKIISFVNTSEVIDCE